MTAGPAPVPAAGRRRTLPEVRADLAGVVGRALEPAHLAVWLADGER
jgi:hypothetical protein